MKRNRLLTIKKRIAAAGICSLLLAASLNLTGCDGCAGNQETTAATEAATEALTTQSQAIEKTIEWKGKTYTYNRDLINLLFLGIDKEDEIAVETLAGDAGQSDCIMILSLDKEQKTGRILQINRNTMTEIDVYDKTGTKTGSFDGQITLQYACSTGGKNSCYAAKKTVSELLFGLQIDGYLAMDMGAIDSINDALGGVEVTLQDDYTMIDPAFVKGETVTLKGQQAERFVRYRDTNEFGSVEGRMERQVEYITALIAHMKKAGGSKLYDILEPYLDTMVITDLDADQMNALKNYSYLTDEVEYLPGEMKMGEKYEEYYVDEDKLQDLIFKMFYKEVPKTPTEDR